MSIIRSNKLPAISPGKVLQKLLKQNNLSTSESAKLLDLSLCDLTKLIEGNMQVGDVQNYGALERPYELTKLI